MGDHFDYSRDERLKRRLRIAGYVGFAALVCATAALMFYLLVRY